MKVQMAHKGPCVAKLPSYVPPSVQLFCEQTLKTHYILCILYSRF